MGSVLLLAFEAALYPTLLAVVVILLAQESPRRLLAAYYVGGMITSVGVGIAIVALLNASHELTSPSSGLSWTADLTVGGLSLLLAWALSVRADERFRTRRRERRPPKPADAGREPWSQRILARGSVPLVFAAGLIINVPGAAYLIALKDIATGSHSSADELTQIVIFNLIMFLLAEIPLVGLIVAPDRTDALVARMDGWLGANGRRIAILLCVTLGAFLVTRGLVRAN
jgi:Sap-like sulfolipid-1-addressing protein